MELNQVVVMWGGVAGVKRDHVEGEGVESVLRVMERKEGMFVDERFCGVLDAIDLRRREAETRVAQHLQCLKACVPEGQLLQTHHLTDDVGETGVSRK